MAEQKEYAYFQKDVIFLGKHARYIDELWSKDSIGEQDFFNRLYDLYILAVIIGLRTGRKSPVDNVEENKRTIQTSALLGQSQKLNELMKLVLLIDDSDNLSNEECVNRAFRGPKSDKEFNHNVELFNAYARGGIEVLYEELKLRILDLDDQYTDQRIGNIVALIQSSFDQEI